MSASTESDRVLWRRQTARIGQDAPVLIDGFRFVRHPSWEIAIARDLRRTARRLPPALSVTDDVATRRRVLVALYRDDIFEAKLALVLATALREQSLEPIVLAPSRRSRHVSAYARRFGVDELVTRESIDVSDQRTLIDDAVEDAVARLPDYHRLKAWDLSRHQAGLHLLSTVIRLTQDGAPDLDSESMRQLVRTVARDTVTNYLRYERVFDRYRPDVVLVEESGYSVNGPLVDVAVARGVDVIHTFPTGRDDVLISKRLDADTRRSDSRAVPRPTFEELARRPWDKQREDELWHEFAVRYRGSSSGRDAAGATSDEHSHIEQLVGGSTSRPTAVIFPHVLWDASLFFGEDLFDNYADWLVHCVGAAIKNEDVTWIIKAHPANLSRALHGDTTSAAGELALLSKHHPELPAHVKVLEPGSPVSARALYEYADYGVTVRGTPGIEMACFGKSVFTAGTGGYSGLGFTHDSSSADEFLERMADIHTYPPLAAEGLGLARRYAHAAFIDLPWRSESFSVHFDFADSGWHPLDRNVVLAPNQRSSPLGPDLRRWASWVATSDSPDPIGYTPP